MKSISLAAVTVGYGDGPPVLREVSMTAPPGQLTALTGPSGAGKTTALRTMAGLLRPTTGEVLMAGQSRRAAPDAGRVAFIPQGNGLATVLTVEENLLVALAAANVEPAARSAAATALDRLGLRDQRDQLLEELSGGQQQRAAVARGLVLAADVVLADEVTSELDEPNRERVLSLLRSEAERGAAVVLATHDPAASEVCDAEVRLRDGRVEQLR
ncbi:ATP-binding cassette domain-containing protein [Natronosporangium hydrolyticum]|uniref:ATP-binding cassette domain-containing protein n=1 Tax=Natronosporangium hydrolyticum TaxID=2811111 RepID=A0A895YLR9_9ACTN|nr:ATP-binding cassette domain-containing protein [Natronosporangium hydrolyticum]QSB16263.1 ATP-binding cassette domain-containing protein [Natronosporangium hydrolyticum]